MIHLIKKIENIILYQQGGTKKVIGLTKEKIGGKTITKFIEVNCLLFW